jgi:hypothetical protein
MNLTKVTSEKIFYSKLLPLAEKLRDNGRHFFQTGAVSSADTYYKKREKTAFRKEDFELTGCESYGTLEKALSEIWVAQGYPELSALAPLFAELAKSVHSIEEKDEEVSPFIYVMF